MVTLDCSAALRMLSPPSMSATEMEGAVVSLAVEVVACVAGLPAMSLTSALTVRVPSFKEERSRSEREKLPSLLTVADVLKMSPPPSEEIPIATSPLSESLELLKSLTEPEMETDDCSAALRTPSPPSSISTERETPRAGNGSKMRPPSGRVRMNPPIPIDISHPILRNKTSIFEGVRAHSYACPQSAQSVRLGSCLSVS